MNIIKRETDRIFAKIHQQLRERKEVGSNLDFKNPWILIATWFGSGAFLPASGTWGTLATLPFAIPILMFGGKLWLGIFLIAVFILGLKAADVFEKKTGLHDCSLIVVDEVIGFCIALLVIPFTATWIAIAFIIFRGFDTVKPWPISWIDEKTGGAWGVIADDIAAGAATALTLLVLQHVGPLS